MVSTLVMQHFAGILCIVLDSIAERIEKNKEKTQMFRALVNQLCEQAVPLLQKTTSGMMGLSVNCNMFKVQIIAQLVDRLVLVAATIGIDALPLQLVNSIVGRFWPTLSTRARCALWACRHDLLMTELFRVLEFVVQHPYATSEAIQQVSIYLFV